MAIKAEKREAESETKTIVGFKLEIDLRAVVEIEIWVHIFITIDRLPLTGGWDRGQGVQTNIREPQLQLHWLPECWLWHYKSGKLYGEKSHMFVARCISSRLRASSYQVHTMLIISLSINKVRANNFVGTCKEQIGRFTTGLSIYEPCRQHEQASK